MRYADIIRGVTTQMNNEEASLFDKFAKSSRLIHNKLSEREQLVIDNLVKKNIVTRLNEDDEIVYRKTAI